MTDNTTERRSRRLPQEKALEEVRSKPAVSIDVTASAIGRSEATTRRAVEAGQIRAVRLGRNWSVLTGPLREQFGIDA